jgi:hypothetical protein
MAQAATPTTDHEEIRRWAEAQGGHPARVKGTGRGKDPGMLRIDFPGFSGEGKLEEISWNEFFKWFDVNELALLYRQKDRFNKIISRDTAQARSHGQRTSRRRAEAGKPPAQRAAKTRGRIEERRRKAEAPSRPAKPKSRAKPKARTQRKPAAAPAHTQRKSAAKKR